VVLINIWAFSCLYMGYFVPALNGSCSCPPMGRDLSPNPARYNGPCRPGTKLFRVVSCLGHAFFRASGRPIRPGPNVHLYPGCTARTSGRGSRPPQVQTRPLGRVPDPSGGVRATHSRVPGFQGKEYSGLNQG
jgi:hypothetical protein